MIHPEDNLKKILNPNQKQLLDDERRLARKIKQLSEQQGSASQAFLRPQERETDPDILDYHDSFYKTTKSLLVLFQIMGIMPIMRSTAGSNKPRTTFHWTSKAHIWAYVIYGLETVLVVWVAHERIGKFISTTDKRFDEVIYNVIFMSILLPHFLLPVASWRHGSEVAKFKNMWTHYQVQYLRVTGTPMLFPSLYPLTWALCFVSWGLSIVIILSQYYLQRDFPFSHTFAYYHIIAMLNGFCSLWYINCTAFGMTSRELSKHLIETLKSEKPSEKLTEYRHLWVDLSHQMQQLGRAYSNMYGIYCLVIFFTTIIATYGALSEIIDRGGTFKELGLFVIMIYCMTLLFIICNEAHAATKSVGLDFQDVLLNVNLTGVDNDTQREVEMFLVAIAKNPPTMNLDGFANINRELITSNISFMATYLVVLMQFKLTLLRQAARTNFLNSLKNNMTMRRIVE
uniref:Gustatory receptor n=2 Tax=Lutzomyia longipalpis TaxID=7200 RepID=A0A1B0CPT9_LUTLO